MMRNWLPMKELNRLQDEMSEMFSGLKSLRERSEDSQGLQLWQNDDGVAVVMQVPGYTVEELDVSVNRDHLTISGNLPETEEGSEQKYPWKESFTRTVRLPYAVEGKSITAKLEHGVLVLKIAKPEELKPVRIAINQN